jgi:hypothetical protein
VTASANRRDEAASRGGLVHVYLTPDAPRVLRGSAQGVADLRSLAVG